MIIGIDISQIVFQGTGVGVYTKNLVDNLLKFDKTNTYKFFGSSFRRMEDLRTYCSPFPIPPSLLDVIWNRLHILSVEKLIGKIDVFHSSDWTQPPTKAKKVSTIHDLVVYKYPQTSHPTIVAVQKRRLFLVKKEVDIVVAVSENTKKDMMEILGIAENKIRVVYEAANPIFKKSSNTLKGKPFILAVGTREPRKNLEKLVAAYKSLNLKDVDLKIVGNFGWGEDVKGVDILGYTPPEDLVDLYSNALFFAYPSLYEGFGIPILEAYGCGCPVLTSNLSSLPEVGGDAAIYCDPNNVVDIAEKIKLMSGLSSSKREELIAKGYSQAKKFSWGKTCQEMISIYESFK